MELEDAMQPKTVRHFLEILFLDMDACYGDTPLTLEQKGQALDYIVSTEAYQRLKEFLWELQ